MLILNNTAHSLVLTERHHLLAIKLIGVDYALRNCRIAHRTGPSFNVLSQGGLQVNKLLKGLVVKLPAACQNAALADHAAQVAV